MRHHYVPQFLLKRWQDSSGKVHVFTIKKDKLVCSKRAPKWTGFENDLYAIVANAVGLANDVLERKIFSPLDNNAAKALEKLERHEALTEDDHIAWTFFMSSLRIRQPDVLDYLRNEGGQLVRQFLAEADAKTLRPGEMSSEQWFGENLPGAIDAVRLTNIIPRMITHDEITQTFGGLKWWFREFAETDPPLLLSDMPLHWEGGFKNPEFFIQLPIGPRRLFFGTRSEKTEQILSNIEPADLIARANRTSLASASQRVWAQSDAPAREFIQANLESWGVNVVQFRSLAPQNLSAGDIAAVFGEDLAAAKACTAAAPGASLAPVKRKRRSRVMEYFAGLDVSIEETAICVVGDDGKVALETEVPTEPELIAEALERFAGRLRRVGHEAGSISPWLHPEMIALGLPAVCLETRHVRAALSAQRNKTDAADALGIAHIMRTGWFRQAHIKTEECYRIRLLLVQRRNLKRKFLDIENAIRHSLKVFGIRLGKVGRGSMAKAVREAVAGDAMTAGLMDCMLRARAALWEEYLILHKLVTQLAMRDELCRRFMAIPGVGPVTALTFKSAIDDPARFRRSRNVAAYFGLTSRRWQSGSSIDVKGRISKAGDPDVRRALYEAASAMLTRFKGRDTIKTWGLKLAKTKCHAKARVAVARKLAIVMHAMWRDGTFYVGDPDAEAHEIDSAYAAKMQRLSYARS